MSDLRERVEQLFASTEAALEADDSLGRDWIGDNSRLVVYRLLRDLRAQVLAVLPQRPVAGDREALLNAIHRQMRLAGLPAVPPDLEGLSDSIADAVDTVRPEPLPLREAWLREVEKHLNSTQAFGSPPVLDRERAQRLLAAYRFQEASFDERGDPDGPDGVTAWQRGFSAGVEAMKRKDVDLLRDNIDALSRQRSDGAVFARRLLEDLLDTLSRGPVRPDSLRELRQEARQAQEENEKLREQLAAVLPHCKGCHGSGWSYRIQYPNERQPCLVCDKARALLEGNPT